MNDTLFLTAIEEPGAAGLGSGAPPSPASVCCGAPLRVRTHWIIDQVERVGIRERHGLACSTCLAFVEEAIP